MSRLDKPIQTKVSKLDLTKPVQTKEGQIVRIVCTDREGPYPVLGIVLETNKVVAWTLEGKGIPSSTLDTDLENSHEPAIRVIICWNTNTRSIVEFDRSMQLAEAKKHCERTDYLIGCQEIFFHIKF